VRLTIATLWLAALTACAGDGTRPNDGIDVPVAARDAGLDAGESSAGTDTPDASTTTRGDASRPTTTLDEFGVTVSTTEVGGCQTDCPESGVEQCRWEADAPVPGMTAPFVDFGHGESDAAAFSDGGAVVVGTIYDGVDFHGPTVRGVAPLATAVEGPILPLGRTDGFVVRLEDDCTPRWIRALTASLPGSGVVQIGHVGVADDGAIYIGGTYRGALDVGLMIVAPATYYAAWFARLDADGVPVWVRAFPGVDFESYVIDMLAGPDGRVSAIVRSRGRIAIAFDQVGDPEGTALWLGLDPDGNVAYAHVLDPALSFDQLSLAPDGSLLALGSSPTDTQLLGISLPLPSATMTVPERVWARLTAQGDVTAFAALPSVANRIIDRARITALAPDGFCTTEHVGTDTHVERECFDATGASLGVHPWIDGFDGTVRGYAPIADDGNDLHALLHVGSAIVVDGVAFDPAPDESADVLVVVSDTNARTQWTRRLGGDGAQIGAGFALTPNGETFVAVGTGPSVGVHAGLVVVKLGP